MTGRAYRRRQQKLRNKDVCKEFHYSRGAFMSVKNKDGSYRIKQCGKRDSKKFFKNYSNRVVRRSMSDIGSAKCGYRKEFDYWWIIT